MSHSVSHTEQRNQKHSINLCNHERYLGHLKCLKNIQNIKYPDFQAMTPRRRGWGGFFRQRGGHSGSDQGEGWPRSKGRFRGGRGGFSQRGRFQGRKFDKSPTAKRP